MTIQICASPVGAVDDGGDGGAGGPVEACGACRKKYLKEEFTLNKLIIAHQTLACQFFGTCD